MPRILWIFLAFLAVGCRREAAVGGREVKDGMGRLVRLPPAEKIGRIVSLAPSSTEILFALGMGGRLVGVDGYSDFPKEAAALPRVGADVDPSLEKIVALKPDLVLTATSANTQATAETLERLSVPVFVSHADSLEDIYRDVRAIGAATGRDGEAAALAQSMRGRVAAVAARRAGAARVPSLVVVWSEPLVVAGSGSHVGDLLAAAGGENLAGDSPQPFPTYSLERLVVRAPEVVVVGTHATGSPPIAPLERVAARTPKPFRIATADGDLLFRPGPRVADGVELLDRLLHPGAP
jgi:ABC-type Fe3+-hydroxamate transport system substrate-binding protein